MRQRTVHLKASFGERSIIDSARTLRHSARDRRCLLIYG